MIGATLQNRYRIDAELGRGGMGEVYRATDTQTGELVAVKVLNPQVVARDPEILERFVREGQALRQLNHPNIVRMIAAVQEQGQHYLVVEYVSGGSLADVLAAQGRLTSTRVMQIALEVADALTRTHHLGIIHRDLKPANVLLAQDGTPRLADFGIAHVESDQRLTQTGVLMGTIDYLSPEVCQGQPPNERADIWAFGVMLFEMLSGRLPFEGNSLTARLTAILTQPVPDLAQLAPDVPAAFIDLVYRMLAKDPQQRIPSVRLVGAELEAMLKGREPVAPPRVTPAANAHAPRHNLPTQLSTFIGREKEIAQVKQLLTGESRGGVTPPVPPPLHAPLRRLVTLTGSGGIGKTRLAIQVGCEVLPLYPHGVWLVELAPLAKPELVPGAVATVLGVRDSQDRPVLTALTDYLREKTALLVLDNCEHVIDACAQLAEHLLQHCPEVRILASSREALGIEGETAVRVPSLSLPPAEGATRATRETLEQSEAVRLFVERAATALPGFELSEANAPAIVQVCRRLDGVALAIELAAARVRLLKVDQIAARLDDAFRLLTGGSRTALPRQQTLRATIDWSYNLLTQDERTLLRRLSVFAGGWTLEAAEAVCAGDGVDARDVLELLTQLVFKSLVTVECEQGEAARYRLLETTRQYAREKLAESGEGEAVRGRHLDYYLELAERIEPQLMTSEEKAALKQEEAELDNVRAALEWSLAEARTTEVEKGLRLASALEDLWFADARTRREGAGWLQRGLALLAMDGRPESALVRAKALRIAGVFVFEEGMGKIGRAMIEESVALYRAANLADKHDLVYALAQLADTCLSSNDLQTARTLAEESVAFGRELEPSGKWHLAFALVEDGVVAMCQGDYTAARSRYQEGLALFRQVGDRTMTALTIRSLGLVASRQGDHVAERSLLQEALRENQLMGWKESAMDVTNHMGILDYVTGDYESARVRFEETLSYYRDMGHKLGTSVSLRGLGLTMLRLGDTRQAARLLRESLLLSQETQSNRQASMGLAAWAAVLQARGEWGQATVLLGAVESQANQPGNWWPAIRTDYDQTLAAAWAALGEEVFAAAMVEGRAMTIKQAVAYALEETGQ